MYFKVLHTGKFVFLLEKYHAAFLTEVNLVLSSLVVKNSEVMVIMAREMAPAELIPVGAAFVPGRTCMCFLPRGSICIEESKSHCLGEGMT